MAKELQTYDAGDGTVSSVIWLTSENQPTTPEKASFARITSSDGESAVFVVDRLRGAEFNPDQPRDESGRWTDTGGGSTPSKALTSGHKSNSKTISGSANGVRKVTLVDDQGNQTEAIFKPTSGESWTNGDIGRKQFLDTYGVDPESDLGQKIIFGDPELHPELRDLPAFDPDDYGDLEDDSPLRDSIDNRSFSYTDRELAAYEVDQALELNVIPPTVVREIDGERGVVQQFVNVDRDYDEKKLDPDSVYGAAVLDIVTGNTDRHAGNFLMSNNRFVAIDQGLTFPSNGSEFRPQAISSILRDNFGLKTNMSQEFAASIKQKLEDTDWEKLSSKWSMSDEEESAFFTRIQNLREAFDTYPTPEAAIKRVLRDMLEATW